MAKGLVQGSRRTGRHAPILIGLQTHYAVWTATGGLRIHMYLAQNAILFRSFQHYHQHSEL